MNEPELWIVVRNWERFQHYGNRTPPWVKVYTELLDDPNFLALTPSARAVLLGIWLQYARGRRALPGSTSYLSRAFHMRVSSQHLESLNDAGFIDIVASKPLAPRARSQEVEAEEEKSLPAIASLDVQAGIFHNWPETEEPWK